MLSASRTRAPQALRIARNNSRVSGSSSSTRIVNPRRSARSEIRWALVVMLDRWSPFVLIPTPRRQELATRTGQKFSQCGQVLHGVEARDRAGQCGEARNDGVGAAGAGGL